MDQRLEERLEGWDSKPLTGGFAELRDLADGEFSGVARAGRATLYMLNGRVVGVAGGSIDEFRGDDATVYRAPHPSLPLLFAMKERGGQQQAKYYTNDTPISEAHEQLADAGFTGYIELSENVLSGDYYVLYYGGRSLSCAFVGNAERLEVGDDAFELADDEVGIYEVRSVELEVTDIPEPAGETAPDSGGDRNAGGANGPAGTQRQPGGQGPASGGESGAERPREGSRATGANDRDGGRRQEAGDTPGTGERRRANQQGTGQTRGATDADGPQQGADAGGPRDGGGGGGAPQGGRGDPGGEERHREGPGGDRTRRDPDRGNEREDAPTEPAAGGPSRTSRDVGDDDGAGGPGDGGRTPAGGTGDAEEGRPDRTDPDRDSGSPPGEAVDPREDAAGGDPEEPGEPSAATDTGSSAGDRESDTYRGSQGSADAETSRDRGGPATGPDRQPGPPTRGDSDGSAGTASEGESDVAADTASDADTGQSATEEARDGGPDAQLPGQRDASTGESSGQHPREEAAADRAVEAASGPEGGSATGAATASEGIPKSRANFGELRTIPSLSPDDTRVAEPGQEESLSEDGAADATEGAEAADADSVAQTDERTSGDGSVGASSAGAGDRPGTDVTERASQAVDVDIDTDATPSVPEDAGREELRRQLAAREERIEELEAAITDLRVQRDGLTDERDRLEAEVADLEAEVADLEAELERVRSQLDDGMDGTRRLAVEDALSGTNLFVRYDSKSGATLKDAHAGDIGPEEVNENLRLEHHTQFEAEEAVVEDQPFEQFLVDTMYMGFVKWVVRELLYEIQDTGHVKALRELYDAIPRIDRAELLGDVSVQYVEDGEEYREQRSFDVVLRDRMGNPLIVANLNDSRTPADREMMESIIENGIDIKQSSESLAAAVTVTASFFKPGALEAAAEAHGGGLLSRDAKESYVKLNRKRGFHLVLVESREGDFHVNVPEL